MITIMKKNEIIELNDFEYTLELNRDSFLKIDQYSNVKKSMETIQKDLYEYIDEIDDNTDPFAEEIDYEGEPFIVYFSPRHEVNDGDAVFDVSIVIKEDAEEKANNKINTLHRILERAFWIWLYPEHKLNITEVKEILKPYFDDDDKFQFLCDKYGEYMQKCVEIRNEYNENQKNLKAQASKKN